MKRHLLTISFALAALAVGSAQAQTPPPARENHDLGFKDTPVLPGLPWHVHDPDRPHPPVVTAASTPGGAPSDAVVLFDGKDLSKWQSHASSISKAGNSGPAEWKVSEGYVEVVPRTGDIATKDKFGDIQLHLEWSSPNPPVSTSQGRGNSGVLLMGRYEVQVLDAWNNPTYADGQAGAIYGQWPPLANPGRKPGEWNVYDIMFEAPRMDGEKVLKPAIITVLFNGVLVQNHKESMGPMVYRQVAHYVPQPAEDSLVLQNHNNPVRYRNIWVRRLGNYDAPEKK
ncbi:MAG: hypothetical protein QOJ99_1857 [Bryobacterales bacterium]|jgi:hypothetical protein|nr:hypothetical protein [Bryobacterales bacterium]